VTVNQVPRTNSDTVDIDLRLTPAPKFAFTANLEASKNQGNVLLQGESNLIGLGLRLGLVNRNFVKAANQATTNLRYGIELNAGTGEGFVQTQQFILSNTIQFPRGVPKELIPPKSRENTRTFLALNAGYTDRIDYYNISTLNASWGYEFNWRNKIFSFRFPNIEYNLLTRRTLLDLLIAHNASYKYIFNDGLILSNIFNYKIAGGKNKVSKLTNLSLETSGLLAGLIKTPFLDSNLYRFVRVDVEHTQTYKIRRTALAWRIFGGVGYEVPSAHNRYSFYLPFYREFYAGGPNSMRAWGIRKLGPGSAIRSFAKDTAPDRFGDMRFELNGEYRFYMTKLFGFNVEGALFTDIGNVWFLRSNPDFPGGEFLFSKLWKDIAIGAGTGMRIDFGFLKARFDYAYKAKDPSPDNPVAQNKWFYNWNVLTGQFQLGIDYPF
jgi:outer membrane protein assembly factor BamA